MVAGSLALIIVGFLASIAISRLGRKDTA